MSCHFLLQGIFLTLGSNPGFLHCKWILYCLNHQGNPKKEDPSKTSQGMFRDHGFPPLSRHFVCFASGSPQLDVSMPCHQSFRPDIYGCTNSTRFYTLQFTSALLSFNLNVMSGKKKTGTQLNKNGQEQIQLRFLPHPSLSLFTFMHWRRKWQPTPVFLPGESQGRGSLVGCRLWGRTELDTTEAT